MAPFTKKRSALSLVNPLKKPGIRKLTPPNVFSVNRPPTVNDYQGYQIGDEWLNRAAFPANDIYKLVNKDAHIATWINLAGGQVETLTGDAGGAVDSSATDNIDVLGTVNEIITTGNPATNTITWSLNVPILVEKGGTGATSITDHSLIVGSGTAAITELGVATDGQLPIGSTAADPVLSTLTPSGAITITNGPGSITIGGGGTTWKAITFDQTIVVYEGYICNKAGLLELLLPTLSAVGTTFSVTGINTDLGWSITQLPGNQIHFGNMSTAIGAGGSLSSTLKYDSVTLVCVVEDDEWVVINSVGNLTVV